ncbi:hypothetical protein BC939DRAFT_112135 [Gamsiella multidivaricata]|uniref:uncharacterized protein n=1 Tax=Gamsiella multidivaricata TaxID=101098 RepID=UPI0022205AC3|nr:uncharacterized protein BC939DRAFT_112135 [Gamsiella multidivaricata]KAI7826531.1 hypothetical protein BC939DRAFT_112135 [Gamsiella multidivaricata]
MDCLAPLHTLGGSRQCRATTIRSHRTSSSQTASPWITRTRVPETNTSLSQKSDGAFSRKSTSAGTSPRNRSPFALNFANCTSPLSSSPLVKQRLTLWILALLWKI